MLQGVIDFYRCMHVKVPLLPMNFPEVLAQSLSEWSSQKVKGVWILVPTSQIELTAVCRDQGFYPHHVNDSGVMMAKWLLSRPNTLPSYSTHYVGVGGVAFHPDGKILLVKNRYSGIGVSNWRVPGGLVDCNELITDAAVREVFEETNIQTRPIGVIGFREKKNYQFERPDIYFLVLLETLTYEYTLDPVEITECTWGNFSQWTNEDLPGDARKMLKYLTTGANIPPFDWLKSLILNYSHSDYISPNYTATHYYHLSVPK